MVINWLAVDLTYLLQRLYVGVSTEYYLFPP